MRINPNRQLALLVRRYPALYDSKHPNYKDRFRRNRMWQEIGDKLQITLESAKNKWRNLRDSYAKYLKANYEYAKDGKTTSRNLYFGHAKIMEFMKGHTVGLGRRRHTSITHSKESDTLTTNKECKVTGSSYNLDDNSQASDELSDMESEEESEQVTVLDPEDLLPKNVLDHAPKIDASGSVKFVTPGRMVNNNDGSIFHEESSECGEMRRRPRRVTKPARPCQIPANMTYSAVEQIFLGYAQVVSKFSRRRQALVKLKIAEVIGEAELAEIEDGNLKTDEESTQFESFIDDTGNANLNCKQEYIPEEDPL